MSGFGDTAHEYKSAGWNVVPIPHGSKRITITGYTGNDGIDASGADIQAWIEGGHDGDNIGLRMPENVVGIDIDAYHDGLTTLAALVENLGPLTSTPRTTARTDGSGISFYRIPVGTLLPSGLGKGIDIVRRGHRYAVAPPSLHPEGNPYRWLDSEGTEVDSPAVGSLPMLPPSWVDHLDGLGAAPAAITAPDAGPVRLTDGSADAEVARALADALEAAQGESGSRHDTMLEHINRVVRLAERGHPGTTDALVQLRAAYVLAIGSDRSDAATEFDRMVHGAQVKVGQTPSAEHYTVAAVSAMDEMIGDIRSDDAVNPVAPAGPRARRASEMVAARRKEWLAEGRIPKGQLTLLVGAEGIGKSAWWVWLVAKLTTGTPAPEFGITGTTPREVVLIITEDPWATDVLPRLIAAGADLNRVRVVSEDADGEGSPTLPTNLDRIPEDADLVIVDAWSDTLPANLSVKDSQQARRALHPLKEWCASSDTSMLLVTHTNRLSTGSTRDAYGSTGELRKAARSTLLAQREADTEDVLTVGTDKSNGARVGVASRFQTFGVVHDDIETVAVRFVGQSDSSAAQQFQAAHDIDSDQGESRDCTKWLREFLTTGNGSAEAKVVQAAARAELYSTRALNRAKANLAVVSKKAPGIDNGPWLWVLPAD
ncbi:AAA family ATPase [Rhodococcoides fascians A25f]|uniref:bifunctional DNA primase/polymerase n=1 Tax=Rhodococcoides fascians TaxID=1828 RepID=UPI00068BCA65|nr:bifunctional DNA primase/polymerase [Rhodococcus fascians]QII06960.1 AAA family ATPase [Rhodococcus fascians A25f]